ncbi:MAG: hypothetical protein ILO68_01005 [Clostridia bacterium]|nr:hypothetical protein [Clostridia bacterium]
MTTEQTGGNAASREDILRTLKEILRSADDRNPEAAEKATEATNLTTDLGLSSVSMLYLVIVMEDTFGIRFDDIGVQDFATVGDVIDYICAKQKEALK